MPDDAVDDAVACSKPSLDRLTVLADRVSAKFVQGRYTAPLGGQRSKHKTRSLVRQTEGTARAEMEIVQAKPS